MEAEHREPIQEPPDLETSPECDRGRPFSEGESQVEADGLELRWMRRNCTELPEELSSRLDNWTYHGFAELVEAPHVRYQR